MGYIQNQSKARQKKRPTSKKLENILDNNIDKHARIIMVDMSWEKGIGRRERLKDEENAYVGKKEEWHDEEIGQLLG